MLHEIKYTMYSDRVELHDDYFHVDACFNAEGTLIVSQHEYDARIAKFASWAGAEFCDDDETCVDIRDGRTIEFVDDDNDA